MSCSPVASSVPPRWAASSPGAVLSSRSGTAGTVAAQGYLSRREGLGRERHGHAGGARGGRGAERRGHEPVVHGALAEGERADWAWACERAARDVADGRGRAGVVCCWTGTGASIAANKVAGVRAALCGDAETARGARAWNDANVLALSLRTTSRGAARGDPRRLVRGRAERRPGRPRERRAPRRARRPRRNADGGPRARHRRDAGGGGAPRAAPLIIARPCERYLAERLPGRGARSSSSGSARATRTSPIWSARRASASCCAARRGRRSRRAPTTSCASGGCSTRSRTRRARAPRTLLACDDESVIGRPSTSWSTSRGP